MPTTSDPRKPGEHFLARTLALALLLKTLAVTLEAAYLVGDELDVVVRIDEISLGVQRLHVEPQSRRRYSAKPSLALAAPPESQGKIGEQALVRQSRCEEYNGINSRYRTELLLQLMASTARAMTNGDRTIGRNASTSARKTV